jgi:hypothetical protein
MSLLPTNVMNVYTVMKFEFKIHMLYLCLPVNINIFLTGKKICQKLIKKIFQLKLKKKRSHLRQYHRHPIIIFLSQGRDVY